MKDSQHPLVGKRIVKGNPQRGEVTTDLINRTLGTVEYVDSSSWWTVAMETRRNTWTIVHDEGLVIKSVERH